MYVLLLYVAAVLLGLARGQDVVGCGGFVRSKFPIDFTKVEVSNLYHLFAKEVAPPVLASAGAY